MGDVPRSRLRKFVGYAGTARLFVDSLGILQDQINSLVWDRLNQPTAFGRWASCYNEGQRLGCYANALTIDSSKGVSGVWERIQEMVNNPTTLPTRQTWLTDRAWQSMDPVSLFAIATEATFYYATYIPYSVSRFVYTGIRDAENTLLGWLHYLTSVGLLGGATWTRRVSTRTIMGDAIAAGWGMQVNRFLSILAPGMRRLR